MSQASSSSYGGRVRRILCPNCHVLCNRFMSRTNKNPNRAFHKCPYYAVGGCWYFKWEDEIVDTGVQTQTTPASLHAVPLQAVPASAVIPGGDEVTIYQEGSQAVGVVGNAVVENRGDNRVMQQLRWIEKMIYVCIFLALYAIMK